MSLCQNVFPLTHKHAYIHMWPRTFKSHHLTYLALQAFVCRVVSFIEASHIVPSRDFGLLLNGPVLPCCVDHRYPATLMPYNLEIKKYQYRVPSVSKGKVGGGTAEVGVPVSWGQDVLWAPQCWKGLPDPLMQP